MNVVKLLYFIIIRICKFIHLRIVETPKLHKPKVETLPSIPRTSLDVQFSNFITNKTNSDLLQIIFHLYMYINLCYLLHIVYSYKVYTYQTAILHSTQNADCNKVKPHSAVHLELPS
jgi:hypothetical protein